jgi:hypothetical protein
MDTENENIYQHYKGNVHRTQPPVQTSYNSIEPKQEEDKFVKKRGPLRTSYNDREINSLENMFQNPI